MKCRGIGMALIREFLDEGPDPDVKDLIDRGVLIKISSKQVPKSNKRGREVRTRPGRNKDSIFLLLLSRLLLPLASNFSQLESVY